ncbi:hypothetical protein [Streptomyces sp. NPDC089919]|uniref:hypothetical protein n=1 Tax=Streptomyces sp. NPDC089919 TaxID=3155188 RepID=UPI00342FEE3B
MADGPVLSFWPASAATERISLASDNVQTGSMITLGPGIAVGRHSVIAASVCLGSSVIPAGSVVRSATPEAVIEPRRM